MISLVVDPEAEAIAFARSWFILLANDDWDTALALIDEPNSYGIVWTRELILGQVNDEIGPGTRFYRGFSVPAFTHPDRANGSPRTGFGEFNAGGFWLWYDVPLNGEISDLTAQFEFLPRWNGFAVVLHDLHVL